MAAWLYEGILIFGVVWIAAYLYGSLSQTRHALENRLGLQIFLFIVFGIYFSWHWHRGQTLAMKTWDLRLVGRDGQTVSQWRALLRYLLAWLWFAPPLAAVAPLHLNGAQISLILLAWISIYALLSRLMPQRQFIHDALAGTQLIHHQPMRNTLAN